MWLDISSLLPERVRKISNSMLIQPIQRPIRLTNQAGTGKTLSWIWPILILAFAALIRLAFFRGALGSDEIDYMTQARHVLSGDLGRSTYIGDIRYGINTFQALSFRLFGNGVAGAAGLYFACSLASILLAYFFAQHVWGRRSAIWAALALAVLPIDVALAGSLNPDPYLGLFIASSITVFFFAQRRDSDVLYFLAGLLAGWVFWIKDEVIIFGALFLFLTTSWRSWRRGWLWFLFGGVLCCVSDLIFFFVGYGDPFYHYSVVRHTVEQQATTGTLGETSAWTYLRLLLVNIYHTGLLGWFALAGCVVALRQRPEPETRFVLIWAVGLLVIFSALPVSFSPLHLIRKQANYMEIFVMPLALLAGFFLARQRQGLALALGGPMMVLGVVLSGLEQQVISAVAVNGPGAAAFAEAHAGTPVFGPLIAQRQSAVERLLRGSLDSEVYIRPMADLNKISLVGGEASDVVAYVVEDPQMRNWQGTENELRADRGYRLPPALSHCLIPRGQLDQKDPGLGRSVLAALRGMFSLLPPPYASAAIKSTDPIWQIEPAQLFAVTRECAQQFRDQARQRGSSETPAVLLR